MSWPLQKVVSWALTIIVILVVVFVLLIKPNLPKMIGGFSDRLQADLENGTGAFEDAGGNGQTNAVQGKNHALAIVNQINSVASSGASSACILTLTEPIKQSLVAIDPKLKDVSFKFFYTDANVPSPGFYASYDIPQDQNGFSDFPDTRLTNIEHIFFVYDDEQYFATHSLDDFFQTKDYYLYVSSSTSAIMNSYGLDLMCQQNVVCVIDFSDPWYGPLRVESRYTNKLSSMYIYRSGVLQHKFGYVSQNYDGTESGVKDLGKESNAVLKTIVKKDNSLFFFNVKGGDAGLNTGSLQQCGGQP